MYVDLVQRKKYGGKQINNVEIKYNTTVRAYWRSTKKQCKGLPVDIVKYYAYITLSEDYY